MEFLQCSPIVFLLFLIVLCGKERFAVETAHRLIGVQAALRL